MSRRYQDPVEVRLGDAVEHRVRLEPGWCRGARPARDGADVPTTFLWRGRVHLVRGVLAQWTQRVPWWRQEEQRPDGDPRPRLEQEVWRVEATTGRAHGSGVYDLVHGEQWLLERVSD